RALFDTEPLTAASRRSLPAVTPLWLGRCRPSGGVRLSGFPLASDSHCFECGDPGSLQDPSHLFLDGRVRDRVVNAGAKRAVHLHVVPASAGGAGGWPIGRLGLLFWLGLGLGI